MDKQYVGNGKTITTQFGDILKMSMTADDLKVLQDNLSNGWVNFDVLKRREPSEKGMTHYAVLNTWKPENQEGGPAPAKSAPAGNDTIDEMDPEDLPF